MQVLHGYLDAGQQLAGSVIVIGNLDGLHLGHQELIRQAKLSSQRRSIKCAVYTFSPHPCKVLPGKTDSQLMMTDAQKLRALESFGVDAVIVEPFTPAFSQIRATEFISEILQNHLGVSEIIVGENFRFGFRGEGTAALLQDFFPTSQVVKSIHIDELLCSSTRIRDHIRQGHVEDAAKLLGRPYSLEGIVVHGSGRGKQIGTPTANLETTQELIPRNGVYGTHMKVGDSIWKGATNIGTRPTFDGDDVIHIETHLIGYDANLYDQNVELFFNGRIRDEMKFNSVEELKAQIRLDLQAT